MENRHGSSRSSRGHSAAAKKPGIELGSILVFALCIFTFFALISYNPIDPSFLSNAKGPAQNLCGRVGAQLASILLQWFGMGAFLLPAAFLFISSTLHRREGFLRIMGTLGGMAAAVMSLTVFLTLQWKYWPFGGTLLLTGGALGAWVADALIKQFNPVGSSIVSLLVFFTALALSTPMSVALWGGRAVTFSAKLVWQGIKILAGYFIYFVSLAALRFARGLAEMMQELGRDIAERMEERRRQKALVGEQVSYPENEIQVGQKHIFEGDSEGEELDQQTSYPQSKNSFSSVVEAPNALPELETAGRLAQNTADLASTLGGRSQEGGPQILPREADKNAKAKPMNNALRSKRGQWKLPTIEFLRKPPKLESAIDRDRLLANSQILKQKFADFGIDGEVTAVRPGPVITLYEFKPGPGVKVSRIAALVDDLSMALSAQSVRILAPLPGKSVVGIEIPSDTREIVYLREFLQHPDFYGQKHTIPVVMGKDISGQTYLSDLARMPHLLCAGQTGAGKSVFMNGLICSLFYRFTPDELRMILVDPKFIEFRAYQDIPHLLLPVVDDPKQAATALKWAVREMERRYRILAKLGARNLATFNQKVEEMGAAVVHDLLFSEENQAESITQTTGTDWIEAFEPDESGAPRVGKLPYIVVIIDELADLMMVAKKEVEISIARIAQKARAAGIHLVIATQRPSTDVVTGLIKANLPSRVSFQLASYVDSKTILDRAGAERLLGQGDMLFIPPGVSQSIRLHGAYLDDEEIEKVTSYLKSQGKPVYRDEILFDDESDEDGEGGLGDEDDDELFQDAIELVKRSGHASASFLQRHLKVGYNRAARMIETMEARGIVGPPDGARPREVLMR